MGEIRDLYKTAFNLFDNCLTGVLASREAAKEAKEYADQAEIMAQEAEEIASKFQGRLLLFRDNT